MRAFVKCLRCDGEKSVISRSSWALRTGIVISLMDPAADRIQIPFDQSSKTREDQHWFSRGSRLVLLQFPKLTDLPLSSYVINVWCRAMSHWITGEGQLTRQGGFRRPWNLSRPSPVTIIPSSNWVIRTVHMHVENLDTYFTWKWNH